MNKQDSGFESAGEAACAGVKKHTSVSQVALVSPEMLPSRGDTVVDMVVVNLDDRKKNRSDHLN